MWMADSKVLLLAMAMAAAALFVGSSPAAGDRPLIVCGRDYRNLYSLCIDYVRWGGPKVAPSADCCREVRQFNVSCVCNHIPEQVVSLEKAIYVAKFCGNKIPSGTICGHYYVPLGGVVDGPN